MQKCAFVRKEEQFAISREIHEGVNFLRGEKENKIEGTLPFPLKVDGLFYVMGLPNISFSIDLGQFKSLSPLILKHHYVPHTF